MLFGIGIMGGTERIRADPAHQAVILDDQRGQHPFADDREIFVATKAEQLDRLTVEQQAVAVNGDGTDADVERVGIDHCIVTEQFDAQLIEIGRVGRPERRIGDGQRGCARHAFGEQIRAVSLQRDASRQLRRQRRARF